MTKIFIINFAGQASPAMINQLAKTTHDYEGKWLITKISYLDKQVSGLIKISMPNEHVEIVKQAFRDQLNLSVYFADSSINKQDENENIYNLRIDADDRNGILKDISNTLEAEHGHILDIESNRVFLVDNLGVSSSMFSSHLTIKLPTETNIHDVISELETIGLKTWLSKPDEK